MAGDAVFGCNWASVSGMIFLRLGSGRGDVARQALRIVVASFFRKRLVGIVACNARKSCVSVSPASAAQQTISLRANVGDAHHVRQFYIPPSAMAGPAKIDRISGTQAPRVESQLSAFFVRDSLLQLTGFHRLHVLYTISGLPIAADSSRRSAFPRTRPTAPMDARVPAWVWTPRTSTKMVGWTCSSPTLTRKSSLFIKIRRMKPLMISPCRLRRLMAFPMTSLNNDVAVDVLISNNDAAPVLLRNNVGKQGHWIGVHLIGQKCNRDAVGARLRYQANCLVAA
jgi:hypothetical protein